MAQLEILEQLQVFQLPRQSREFVGAQVDANQCSAPCEVCWQLLKCIASQVQDAKICHGSYLVWQTLNSVVAEVKLSQAFL